MNETRKKKGVGPRLDGGSALARRWAAAILEVLAGEWTPGDGAAALGVTLPRYYALETRAMNGLVAACEPRTGRRGVRAEKEVLELKKQVTRLERECARKQALLRASQRTAGIQVPVAKARKKRKRRPVVRALKMAEALRKTEAAEPQESTVVNQS